MPTIAITGGAGNLGSLLAVGLLTRNIRLKLLTHKKEPDESIKNHPNVIVQKIDLSDENSLENVLDDVDVVVHFAGVLFKADPEIFLPQTNTRYFQHLLNATVKSSVKRVILISFPHVEGETSPHNPAVGKLDGDPISMHAKTRLAEEKLLFNHAEQYPFDAVSLRVGMVYGDGILMVDVAQWFAKHYLLGIWKKPTYIHLISKVDFVDATIAAALKPAVKGIYHIGDDGVQTLQEFLDAITQYKGNHKPWRMPVWMIMTAARTFELFSRIFNTRSPLTVDFIKIGMVSYYGDTSRMREELLPELSYKTYQDGIGLF